MNGCPPVGTPRQPPPPGVPEVPDGPGGSKLITRREEPGTITLNRETDARSALTRGLKEYLKTLSIDTPRGRRQAFQRVTSTWAEPEERAQYPAAAVLADGPGLYDQSKLSPNPVAKFLTPNPVGLIQVSEFTIDLTLDVWATDPEERIGLGMMLEDALTPVTWMYGFVLELPHYHSARGAYELMSQSYVDTDVDATRRYRRAQYVIKGHIPVYRTTKLPETLPRTLVVVTES